MGPDVGEDAAGKDEREEIVERARGD